MSGAPKQRSKALGKHMSCARKQTILEAPAVYSKFLFVYM